MDKIVKLPSYALFFAALQRFDPAWVREYRFHPTRQWRFDFALESHRIAIEIDGGVWSRGRHSGGAGQIADMAKMNAALSCGWAVYHFTPGQTRNGYALNAIKTVLANGILHA
jgi:very-short-patch-repair endonuclease